jgi:DNA modification methylase
MSVLEGDARLLSYGELDLIVTDPPYNIGYKYNGEFQDNQTQGEYQSLFIPMKGKRVVMIHYAESIIRDIVPILGNPSRTVAWTYPSNTGSRQWRMIAWFNCDPDWSKVRIPYKNPKDKRVKELVKITGGRKCPDNWEVNLVKNVSKEKVKEYTNQIPEEIVRRIILTTAKKGDIIVDPFCGTGTTLSVAKGLGFKFRGYDLNPLAIKLTENRIKSNDRAPTPKEETRYSLFNMDT